MAYSQNEILHNNNENEWSVSIHNNVDQSYKHNGELKEPNIEEYILHGSMAKLIYATKSPNSEYTTRYSLQDIRMPRALPGYW